MLLGDGDLVDVLVIMLFLLLVGLIVCLCVFGML